MAKGRVLVVDDEKMIRWSLKAALEKEGYDVLAVETGEEAVTLIGEDTPDLVLLDITLPGIDGLEVLRQTRDIDPALVVIMITAHKEVSMAVTAMKLGAFDYVEKPFDVDRVAIIAGNAMKQRRLSREVEFYRSEKRERYGFKNVVGESPQIAEVIDIARKVAGSEATTVLLQGESGTGKDLIALAIHYESVRVNNPFMPINVTALPGELLESELMGYEKGAFTDAKTSKKGLFEIASGGTIYLDEIGDMQPGLQAKLLRFIETKTFKRVGGHLDIHVDVRIVAATNKELEKSVKEGRFREDLFYRLNVIPIHIPPLRDRKEDILPLARHFLSLFRGEFKRKVTGFTREAADAMFAYGWPGNVRELKNSVERAMILGTDEYIGLFDLSFAKDFAPERSGSARESSGPAAGLDIELYDIEGKNSEYPGSPGLKEGGDTFSLPEEGVDLEEVERGLLVQALEKMKGNQTKAAKLLGISRDALRYRMKKYDL